MELDEDVALAMGSALTESDPMEHRQPFHMSIQEGIAYNAPEDLAERCSDYQGAVKLEGKGVARHMGRVVWESVHCFQYPNFVEGRGTIEAANGDVIQFTYDGGITYGDVLALSGTVWFDGGIGRFENATGESPITDGMIFFEDGIQNWTAEFGGWVSYDASDRSRK